MNWRKYFEGVVGQSKALDFLSRILESDRPFHGYIFSGPDGVGRFTTATRFAAALARIPYEKWDSCHHILTIGLEKEQSSIGIDRIRNELIPFFHLRTDTTAYRTAIIKDSEAMPEEAQNALLKTLEEPPLRSSIIFIASRAALLPTIVSRSVIVRFNPLSQTDVEKLLIESGIDSKKAAEVSVLSSGSVKTALFLIEHDLIETTQKCANSIVEGYGSFEAIYEALSSLSRPSAAKYCDILLPIVASKTQDSIRRYKLCSHIIELKRAIEANANIRLASLAFSTYLEKI